MEKARKGIQQNAQVSHVGHACKHAVCQAGERAGGHSP